MSSKALAVGWFSFELTGAAGDLIARDRACEWLTKAGFAPKVAMWEPKRPGEVATDGVKVEDCGTVES